MLQSVKLFASYTSFTCERCLCSHSLQVVVPDQWLLKDRVGAQQRSQAADFCSVEGAVSLAHLASHGRTHRHPHLVDPSGLEDVFL